MATASGRAASTIDIRTDEEVLAAAAGGDGTSFEELYRRHADAAWRVAMAVTRDRNDAADAVSEAFTRLFLALEQGRLGDVAFRPYLLTSTRNAAIDILRRSSRLQPSDQIDERNMASTALEPPELALDGEDAALVSRAFSDLPERWRSVLWLTEVEGLPPREAAELLGLSANGAAQLAVRARAGLRDRYLQAHVAAGGRSECQFALAHLGAYVGGGLPARDIAKVDQHLAGCEPCTARHAELEDVGGTLRRIVVPVPLFLGATVLGHFRRTTATSPAPAGAGAAGPGAARGSLTGTRRALALSSAALLVLGVVGVAIKDPRPANPVIASPQETKVKGFSVSRPETAPRTTVELVTSSSAAAPGAAPAAGPSGAAPDVGRAAPAPPQIGDALVIERPAPTAPTSAAEAPASQGTPAANPLQVTVVASDGNQTVAIGIGSGDGSCTGVSVVPGSCDPTPRPAPSGAGIDVTAGGGGLPTVSLGTP